MSSKRGFHMIITVTVSICRRLIGYTSPKRRRLLGSYGNQALDLPKLIRQSVELSPFRLFLDPPCQHSAKVPLSFSLGMVEWRSHELP